MSYLRSSLWLSCLSILCLSQHHNIWLAAWMGVIRTNQETVYFPPRPRSCLHIRKERVHITLSINGCILNFFLDGEFTYWNVVMIPVMSTILLCPFPLFGLQKHSASICVFSRSWQIYIQCVLLFLYGHETHLAQTLQYPKIVNTVSNPLKLTLISNPSSVIINHR